MIVRLNPARPLDLDSTLSCGQAFRWEKHGEWWYGVVREELFKLRQNHDGLEFENAEKSFVEHYIGLQDDLAKIFLKIRKDRHIAAAIHSFRGLRILRQDPWECLISYICATYKNITAIKQMLFNLSQKYGERKCLDGYSFYTFPTPAALARTTVGDLASCGLGYRAKYLSETAKKIHERSLKWDDLRRASYEEAKKELLNFAGIGQKVADCILLFSLEKLEAFPVDVWVRRVILNYYGRYFPQELLNKISQEKSLTNSEYTKLNMFGRKYFGEYAGYAQEYMYHYERMKSKQ